DAATAEYKLGTIDAYVLDESKLPANAQGSLDDTAKTIVYHYKKESKPVTSKVSVVYIDEAGKEIQAAKTISGNAGETYDATTAEYKLAAIKEYILDENKLPTNGKGTFAAADQTVTYHYYKKNVVPAAKNVTVKYVDEAGKEIRDAQTIKGQTGEAYDATTEKYKLVQIEDYQLNEDKLPSNGKGQFSETDQVVTYVYQKTGKLAITSTKYSIYGTRSVAARGHAAGQKNLPKTGEETFLANILVSLGSVILVSALMVLVRRRKV
ncbi:MAG: MucBP domain-containing protein, partial [Enterococcus malodoratus]